MTSPFLVLILIFCLLVLLIYFKVKRFTSFLGILMFILGFSALFLRLYILKDYPFLGLFNKETLGDSFILLGAPTLIFLFFSYYSEHFKKRLKKLEKLLIPYILFGSLQQAFFFWVFTDSFYYLTESLNLTFIASIMFFMSIHLSRKSSIKKYWFLLGVFSFIGAWTYLFWGNILPQMLTHGLLGSILFTEFTNTDQLKSRLG